MSKWEHKIINGDSQASVEQLDALGADGWQLVNVMRQPKDATEYPGQFIYHFKRESREP